MDDLEIILPVRKQNDIYIGTFDNGNRLYFIIEDGHAIAYFPLVLPSPSSGDLFVPHKIEFEGKQYIVKEIGNKAFFEADITSVHIANTIKKIDVTSFAGCERLTHVDIPSSVWYIGERAFSFCILLEKIVLPPSIKFIGRDVFAGCSKLKEIWVQNEHCNLRYAHIPLSVTIYIGPNKKEMNRLENL